MHQSVKNGKAWNKDSFGNDNDIITELPSTNDFIQQKLIRKRDREGTSIDEVIYFFLVNLEIKTFL